MIFHFVRLGNLVAVCIKIINSVVVVGLYYGFLTTFSTGPSYIFLFRAQGMEEGTEKVAATTGFLMGQLVMFISIYYAPLHLALRRPHTITVLALPYLLFHFFGNNHNKDFLDYRSTTRNSMRNFRVQCVFVNNLIFQLFNHFILPSAMVFKLVTIYMFRCNNKMLFVTSSLVGWLIGQIFVIKWLGLVIVWIRQKTSLRSKKSIRLNKYIRYIKYLISDLRMDMDRILTILLFITFAYYLGRMPSPILTPRPKDTTVTDTLYQMEQERKIATQRIVHRRYDPFDDPYRAEKVFKADLSPAVKTFLKAFSLSDPMKIDAAKQIQVNQKENEGASRLRTPYDPIFKKEPLVKFFFDPNCWTQPFRYIDNTHSNAGNRRKMGDMVRTEMAQYFFGICQSDGKERISFTYPPILSSFLERLKSRLLPLPHKPENWLSTNKENYQSFNNELKNRIQALDKGFSSFNILETRTRLCNNHYRKEYLAKKHDPFLNKSYRKKPDQNQHFDSPKLQPNLRLQPTQRNPILQQNRITKLIHKMGLNRLHVILFSNSRTDYYRFARVMNGDIRRIKSTLGKVVKERKELRFVRKWTKRKCLTKKVFRWSTKLLSELDVEWEEYPERLHGDNEMVTRPNRPLILLTAASQAIVNPKYNIFIPYVTEVDIPQFFLEPDFDREHIKGSMPSRTRKVEVGSRAYSYLFLDRRLPSLFLRPSERLKNSRVRRAEERKAFKIVEEQTKQNFKKKTKKRDEDMRQETAAGWEFFPHGQAIRGSLLLTQSFFRKLLLPLGIIGKNVGRILLFQLPEWAEDFDEWKKEVHVNCTYDGIPLSKELPTEWWEQGLHIKILFPFCLKPWNKCEPGSSQKNLKKNKKTQEDFCFLTVFGKETEVPFGSPRKRPSFFKPIFRELKKKIRKNKKFGVLLVFKGKIKFLRKHFKEAKKSVIKSVGLITKNIKEFSKVNPSGVFRLRKVELDESRELKEEKDSLISNQISHESLSQIVSPSSTNSSVTEQKMKDLDDRTSTIRNQIEKSSKEKKKVTSRIKNLRSANKTNSNANRFEKWQILKRKNARIISKFPPFLKLFIERIYRDIFLSSSHIPKMTTKLFLKFTTKMIEKSISNNSRKQEIIIKKKKNPIDFISKSLDNSSNSQANSHSFYDLSHISQAYVFYKLSKIKVRNSYKLRSVLDYQGLHFFPKPEIKDSFEKQGVLWPKLIAGDKKFPRYEMNQWKGWLRGHYQYNLSEKSWSRLLPERWRNALHKPPIEDDIVSKQHSYEYEKDPCLDSNKQFELYSLCNQKETFQKDYRYDLFSYQFLDYENSPFQGNKNQGVSYTSKEDLLGRPFNRPSNYAKSRGRVDTLDMKKVDDQKDLTSQIITSHLTSLAYLRIPETNPPILKQPISNLESWFFPELVLLSSAYKKKPWFIPGQLLLFNLNRKANPYSSFPKSPIEEDYVRLGLPKKKKKEVLEREQPGDRYKFFGLDWPSTLRPKLVNNLKIWCLIIKFVDTSQGLDPKRILRTSIRKEAIHLDLLPIKRKGSGIISTLLTRGAIFLEPGRPSGKQDGQLTMYQTIGISLIYNRKHQTKKKYQKYVSKNQFGEAISTHQRITKNRDKNRFDFLVPETLFSFKRRKKLRILNCLNSKNRKNIARNPVFWNEKNLKNSIQVSHDNKHLDKEKNELMKFKLFLWPNYRFEDLACMNRYWFDTNNGSRFSMLRLQMYPRLKICE